LAVHLPTRADEPKLPNSGLHLSYALSALEIWKRDQSGAPFHVADERAVELFMYGSVAPDIGFFPGMRRVFSEMAHRDGGAELLRFLHQFASTSAQRGYVCGWAAHLLADRVVHPLIDRAAAENLATGELRIAHRPEHVAHMRVEYGLDHRLFERDSRLQRLRLAEPPTAEELEPLRRGYADVHGEVFSQDVIVRGHRTLRRIVHLGANLSRVQTSNWRHNPMGALLRAGSRTVAPPRKWLPASANVSPVLLAILRPCPPPSWLIQAVDEFQMEFPHHLVSTLNQDFEPIAPAPPA
jgi:hypothetical protein